MLPEISLSILDIVQNSIKANAKNIQIHISIQVANDQLSLSIEDDGDGMSQEVLEQVTNPFYTTRTTRSVGLGVPFLKEQTEITGGNFLIHSQEQEGTKISCNYVLSHIDRMPLGDLCSTIHTLIIGNETISFLFTYTVNQETFTLDTKELRNILGPISFQYYEVSSYIKDYLSEHIHEINHHTIF